MFAMIPYLRSPALACSTVLHAGLLAGMVNLCAASTNPQQQVIDISVVKISSPESQQASASTETPEPVKAVKPDALPAQRKPSPPSPHAQEKKEFSAQVTFTPPTSGPQMPEATKTLAASTEPVSSATYLHNTPPAYPDEARRTGAEGEVVLAVEVTSQGDVAEVNITHSSGYHLLDAAARDAVSHWHFVPARRDGQLTDARMIVPVEFRLE